MKPYPFMTQTCTSKSRPVIGFGEPKRLNEVSNGTPPTSAQRASGRPSISRARILVMGSPRNVFEYFGNVGKSWTEKFSLHTNPSSYWKFLHPGFCCCCCCCIVLAWICRLLGKMAVSATCVSHVAGKNCSLPDSP